MRHSNSKKDYKADFVLKTKFLYSAKTLKKHFTKIFPSKMNGGEGQLTKQMNLKLL